MIVYGFAKDYTYDGDGTLKVKVRIPSIHGPYRQQSTKGTYTRDEDLPWITCMLTANLPVEGDVIVLQTVNDGVSGGFIGLGLTGGNYYNGSRI